MDVYFACVFCWAFNLLFFVLFASSYTLIPYMYACSRSPLLVFHFPAGLCLLLLSSHSSLSFLPWPSFSTFQALSYLAFFLLLCFPLIPFSIFSASAFSFTLLLSLFWGMFYFCSTVSRLFQSHFTVYVFTFFTLNTHFSLSCVINSRFISLSFIVIFEREYD